MPGSTQPWYPASVSMESPLPEGPVPLCWGRGWMKTRETGCKVRAVLKAVGRMWVQAFCPGGQGFGALWGDLPSRSARGSRCVPIPLCQCCCVMPLPGMLLGGDFLHGRLYGLRVTVALLLFYAQVSVSLGGSRVHGDCRLCYSRKGGKVVEHLLQNCLGH